MLSPAPIWTRSFPIHSYDVDFAHRSSVESICRFFLEGAWNHAEELGFGFNRLASEGRLWVLSRLLVTISERPQWGGTVTVRTWPRLAKTVFAMRDFQVLSPAGEILAAGSSSWLVLEAATRRPQRADKLLASVLALPEERATLGDPEKLPAAQGAQSAPFAARYSDIDVNEHVNSCRYLGWIFDSYSLEFHRENAVRQVEANYLGEAHAGDELVMMRQENPDSSHLHGIFRTRDNHEICRVRVRWERT